ncbi:unnamed protein product [Rhodiola kirilowii]
MHKNSFFSFYWDFTLIFTRFPSPSSTAASTIPSAAQPPLMHPSPSSAFIPRLHPSPSFIFIPQLHSLPSYPISSYAWLPFASAAAVFNHSGTNPPNGVPCVVAKNHYEEAQKGRGCGGLLFCMQGWGASYGYVITGVVGGCDE